MKNKLTLFLIIFLLAELSFQSHLFAAIVLDNYEEVIAMVNEGQTPIVPVKFSEEKYEIVKHDIQVSVVSKEKIDEVFKEIKSMGEYFQFKKYVGGCESRALEMARLLDQKNLKSIKVFVIQKLFYRDVGWNYHVAPILFVVENNQINPYVIDPMLDSSGPILLLSWYSKVGKEFFEPSYFTSRYVFLEKDIDLELSDYRKEDIEKAQSVLEALKKVSPNGKGMGDFIMRILNR